jgi:hypothetical protein
MGDDNLCSLVSHTLDEYRGQQIGAANLPGCRNGAIQSTLCSLSCLGLDASGRERLEEPASAAEKHASGVQHRGACPTPL